MVNFIGKYREKHIKNILGLSQTQYTQILARTLGMSRKTSIQWILYQLIMIDNDWYWLYTRDTLLNTKITTGKEIHSQVRFWKIGI